MFILKSMRLEIEHMAKSNRRQATMRSSTTRRLRRQQPRSRALRADKIPTGGENGHNNSFSSRRVLVRRGRHGRRPESSRAFGPFRPQHEQDGEDREDDVRARDRLESASWRVGSHSGERQ